MKNRKIPRTSDLSIEARFNLARRSPDSRSILRQLFDPRIERPPIRALVSYHRKILNARIDRYETLERINRTVNWWQMRHQAVLQETQKTVALIRDNESRDIKNQTDGEDLLLTRDERMRGNSLAPPPEDDDD